jgi:VWFA-related protein
MFLRSLLGIALVFQTLSAQDQPVRERVRVGVVRISVTAQSSSGGPVRDLSAEELSLKVDGRPIPIDSLTGSFSPDAGRGTTPPPAPPAERGEPGVAAEPAPPSTPEPLDLAVLIDEGGTGSLDRRDIYRQLQRYLGEGGPTARSVMIARLYGRKLEVVCPWTRDPKLPGAALARLAAHPQAQRVASPYQMSTLGRADNSSLSEEILFARDHFFGALLVMIAAFPASPARRTLVLVSGGAALLSPEDFSATRLATNFSDVEGERGRPQFPDRDREIEAARTGFEVWSDPHRRSWHSQLADVMAKAQENNVALTSVAAEAFDRGTNPGTDAKWPSRPMPGVGPPGSSGLSPRLHVGQTMTTMAVQTGGEAILLPLQTAERLSNQQALEPYVLTFRDPFPDDHRRHRVEIATTRRGVNLQYRRGYRTPTEEEETLDTVMARLIGPAPASNPIAATARITRSDSSTAPLRLHIEFQPPPEHGIEKDEERSVELLFASVDDVGNRSEPAKWSGVARQSGPGKAFTADVDLKTPVHSYRWSIAIRDVPTGLVSYVVTDTRP